MASFLTQGIYIQASPTLHYIIFAILLFFPGVYISPFATKNEGETILNFHRFGEEFFERRKPPRGTLCDCIALALLSISTAYHYLALAKLSISITSH